MRLCYIAAIFSRLKIERVKYSIVSKLASPILGTLNRHTSSASVLPSRGVLRSGVIMIIESAKKFIEDDKLTPKGSGPHWDYLSFRVNSKTYRIVFERNNAYSLNIIRQWSIDGITEVPVKDRYAPGTMVHTDASNGLMGVRPFERNSITWEFLLKPLGLTAECVFEREHPWAMGVQELLNLMAECGIEVEMLYDCQY